MLALGRHDRPQANISGRTVRRVIARLEADGHLLVHRGGARAGSTNSYAVLTGTRNPGHDVTPDNLTGADTSDRPPRTLPCQGTPDTAVSPDPPENHQGTAAPAMRPAAAADPAARLAAEVGEFFERLAGLNPRWQMTVSQRRRLSPAVTAALAAGRTPLALAETAGANADGVRSPYAVLAARLSSAELPGSPARAVRPPWCGQCDERTRMLGFDGDAPAPCPHCKPAATRRQRGRQPPNQAALPPSGPHQPDRSAHSRPSPAIPLSADDDHHAVLPPRRKVPHE